MHVIKPCFRRPGPQYLNGERMCTSLQPLSHSGMERAIFWLFLSPCTFASLMSCPPTHAHSHLLAQFLTSAGPLHRHIEHPSGYTFISTWRRCAAKLDVLHDGLHITCKRSLHYGAGSAAAYCDVVHKANSMEKVQPIELSIQRSTMFSHLTAC